MMKPPPDAEVLDLLTATLWLDKENDFIYAVSKKEPVRTPETLKETLEGGKKLVGDKKICLLLDVTHVSEITREGREYLAKEFPKHFKAVAMISRSTFGKVVANLFLTIKPQPYPTKMFTDEKEAKKWLKKYL
ncbi:MAG: STAS/SEC14 domain-containing protein [Balneolales bacterium]